VLYLENVSKDLQQKYTVRPVAQRVMLNVAHVYAQCRISCRECIEGSLEELHAVKACALHAASRTSALSH
jgi:hypothetical protein